MAGRRPASTVRRRGNGIDGPTAPCSLLPAVVCAAAVGALGLAARDRAWAATFVTYVLAVLLEAVPFLIIGAVISGAVFGLGALYFHRVQRRFADII